MEKSVITILALIFLCLGVFAIFFKSDILKEKTSSKLITRASGFVVSGIALLVIYLINR